MKAPFILSQVLTLSLALQLPLRAAAGDVAAEPPPRLEIISPAAGSAACATVGALCITAGATTVLVPSAPAAAAPPPASTVSAAPAAAPAAPASPAAAPASPAASSLSALPTIAPPPAPVAPPPPPPLFARTPAALSRGSGTPVPWIVEVQAHLRQPALTGNALFLIYDAQDPGALPSHEVMSLQQGHVIAGSRIAARVPLSPEDGFRAGRYLIQVAQIVNGKEVVLAEGELRLQ